MDSVRIANICLDLFCIILSVIPIGYILSGRRYQVKMNLYFLGIAVSNIVMTIGDLADWILHRDLTPFLMHVLSVLTVLYYASSAFALYYLDKYIKAYLNLEKKEKTRRPYPLAVLCGLQVLFAFLSPITGSFFQIGTDGYHRGNLFMLSQLIPFLCYVLLLKLIVVYRKRMSLREAAFFALYVLAPMLSGAAQILFRGIAVLNPAITLGLLMILVNIQFEYEIVLQKKENELMELRIAIMLSQIQPHFLFNVLTGIRKLCETNPRQAKESIENFSRFLRANMNSLTAQRPIPFSKELEHTKAYLLLEQQRFGEKLNVVFQIEDADFFLPTLTLQPIAENAVRHGLMKREEGGTVTIASHEEEDRFVITVSDDGVGFSPENRQADGVHIGIENVRNRLKTLCGGELFIESQPEKGTTVTILIPKEGNNGC